MKYLLVFAILFAIVSASRITMEEGWRPVFPEDWTLMDTPVDLEQTRDVIFMVKLRNTDLLVKTLYDVSTPGNELYGKHLSLEEIKDRHAPSTKTMMYVKEFLQSNGVSSDNMKDVISADMLRVTLTLAQIENIFDVTFQNYVHKSGVASPATFNSYSLPSGIANMIDFVSHVQGLPDIRMKPTKENAPNAGNAINPTVIRSRYNISSTLLVTNSNNSNAVAEFQAQYFSSTDLTTFFTEYVPFAPSSDGVVAKIIGTNTPSDPGVEASLDVQYLMGVAPGAITWFYSQKQFNFYNDLVNWLETLNNETQIPLIISVSYGSQGDYPSATYQNRSDQEYAKIGQRGCSIVYASGDSGAQCVEGCSAMDASYPAVSPHVTAIGATRFCNGGQSGPECAVQSFKSGGGFSTNFDAPSYQSSYTSSYLSSAPATSMPPTSTYNANGRGNPDFAALGDEHFEVVERGRTIEVGGTSCSAPTFSAVITLLNDIKLNKGAAPLGFLNPTLYQWATGTPGAFYDVTTGDNYDGCSPSSCNPDKNGFVCAAGWDAVTGFGTPNFAVLQTLV